MKSLLFNSIFFFCATITFSQTNNYQIQKDAISAIKSSNNYVNLINTNGIKNLISVADGFYPICAYCKSFDNVIQCCQPTNDIADIFKDLGGKGLKELSDKKNSKLKLYFTITENEYFVAEIFNQKKNILYLFKVREGKIALESIIEKVY